ncbi:MAG TPA: DUF4203 domain-containing protein [Candidatus Dormibacteraeota bacterium]|nr:DUF4203 domain-containing protein [Candidatus Dormibacteraeota bacterium]
MNATVIGFVAIVIGLLACFAGYRIFRIVLPILGFLVGFGVGAQLATVLFNEPYLASALSWVIAIVVGLLAATIAFVWWYVSVALAIAGLGYAIGYGAAVGLGVGGTTAVVIAVALAILFALAAIVLRIPTGVVIVVSAFWGASALLGGALVLMGRIEPSQLRNGTVDVVIADSPLLLVIWVVLGVVGIAIQWFTTREARRGDAVPVV